MCVAFMGEWHKMAAVINGLATCFALEDTECKFMSGVCVCAWMGVCMDGCVCVWMVCEKCLHVRCVLTESMPQYIFN